MGQQEDPALKELFVPFRCFCTRKSVSYLFSYSTYLALEISNQDNYTYINLVATFQPLNDIGKLTCFCLALFSLFIKAMLATTQKIQYSFFIAIVEWRTMFFAFSKNPWNLAVHVTWDTTRGHQFLPLEELHGVLSAIRGHKTIWVGKQTYTSSASNIGHYRLPLGEIEESLSGHIKWGVVAAPFISTMGWDASKIPAQRDILLFLS